MTLRLALCRFPRMANKMSGMGQTRFYTAQTDLVIEKIRAVLEEYRQKNYQQELPTRCKKEFLQAACHNNSTISQTPHENCIALEGMQRALTNIGAGDRVSVNEVKSIFDEFGDECGEIGSQTLLKIL